MNEFMIKFASAESALSQMQQLESSIRSEGEEIAKIRSGFNAQFGGRARILQNLRGQMDRMSDLGDSMKTFESSLESILGIYNAVEQNLLGQLEDQIISGTGSTETAPVAEDAGSADETVDRIHHAGKEDERRGLIPGATIIGGATLGSAAYKDQRTGTGQGAARRTDGQTEETSEAETPAEKNEDNSVPMTADFGILPPRGELIEILADKELPENASWEDFLGMLPEDLKNILPEIAVEYLHELFDLLKEFPMPFGEVFFPEINDFINCGIWATFYTLITWYFYQQGAFENGEETASADDSEEDTVDSEEEPVATEKEAAEDSSPTNSDTKAPAQADADKAAASANDPAKDAAKTSKEDGMSAFSKDKTGAAKTPDPSSADQKTDKSAKSSGGHSGGSGGGHSGGSGGGSSYSPDPLIDSTDSGTDATKDYLSGLVGEPDASTGNASDWAVGAMQNWGKEAGGQLAGNGAGDASAPAATAAQGAGVVGRTARSVVCAAVINAGIEVVMHGAGAVSSILGDGQKELFGDIDLGDAE